MRKPLLAVWLCLPLAAWAYHEGPGQERIELDVVDTELYMAREAVVDEDWGAAITGYEKALQHLPSEDDGTAATKRAGRQIRLALNQARMQHKQLVKAQGELRELVAEMAADASADQDLLDEARKAHASAQYYVTWLMRLEGYSREEWEPEIEIARQTYRLLAERAEAKGDSAVAKEYFEDIESAVKLARLDLQELQGIPLPNQ